MKLQLALDDITLENALNLLETVGDSLDIVEVGTPMVIEYGMEPVRQIKARFPRLEILADLKIMDAGDYEAEEALKAGADYITVLGVTDDATIRGAVKACNRYGKKCAVDMICVRDLAARTKEVQAMGAHVIAVHTGVDQQAQGRTPLDDLRVIRAAADQAEVSVAGGIKPETARDFAALNPDVVICGGSILHAADPARAAREIKDAIQGK
ncbi:3-hexulose-6-phosphate synthase [uncultured Faecalibaculum sp.]|uniref:3-hexulose-6-phosphate synthase n=2 Tax=uncultured Faecalibaculum sp. TaxID=1729681 RepID=UPI0025DFB199|nr:3-hexulose-6-phosphate synthase [uncultured Faecalibaculum sp.]